MSVESASYINGLVTTNPTITDPVYKGPDHFWLLKSVLKNTFPGSTGNGFNKAIIATEDELNFVHGVTSAIQTQLDAIWNKVYPIGSIYTNATNSANPATLLGFGTWVRFGEGRVLVSQSSTDALFDVAEETGGSKDAVLPSHSHTGTTGNESNDHAHYVSGNTGGMSANAEHSHSYMYSTFTTQSNTAGSGTLTRLNSYNNAYANTDVRNIDHYHGFAAWTGGINANHYHGFSTSTEGVSAINANVQPYIVVYMWKRTA